MTVTPVALDSGTLSAGGASLVTGTCTPTAGAGKPALYMIATNYIRDASTNTVAPTAVSGMGLTWTRHRIDNLAGGVDAESGSLSTNRNSLYIFIAFGVATAGAITVTNGWSLSSTHRAHWVVLELLMQGVDLDYSAQNLASGSDTPVPNERMLVSYDEQNANSTAAGTQSVGAAELQGVAAANELRLAFAAVLTNNPTITLPSGYTRLANPSSGSGLQGALDVSYCAAGTDTSTTLTWSFSPTSAGAFRVMEIRDPSFGVRELGYGAVVNRVTAGTLSPAYPSGYTAKAGDFAMIFVVGTYGGTLPVPTGLTGWTKENDVGSGAGGQRCISYRKFIATDGEALPTLTFGGGAGDWFSGSSRSAYACVGIYRNVHQSSPIDVAATAIQSTASGTTHPSAGLTAVNPAHDGSLAIAFQHGGETTPRTSSAIARGWRRRSGDGVYLASKKFVSACTPNTPTFGSSGSTFSRYTAIALRAADRLFLTGSPTVDSVVVDTTLESAAAGPFLTVAVDVDPVGVTVALNSRRPAFARPRREFVWVYDLAGNKTGVIV